MQPGQFAVTITDLAGCWHWHRATVRSFLNGLEDLGQIRKSSLTRSYIITMAETIPDGNEAGKNKGKTINPIIDKVDTALSEWVFGRLSGEECGRTCQRLTDTETPTDTNQGTDDLPETERRLMRKTAGQSWKAWPWPPSAASCISTA